MKMLLPVLLALPALAAAPFAWKDIGEGRFQLEEDGRPALVYNYGPQLAPGAPESKRRCCYIYPLYSPAGVSPLDDFPKDHWHHRGLFWAWPIVETGGQRYDLWMQFTARHRSASVPKTSVVAGAAALEAVNFWEAGGKDIVRETLALKVRPVRNLARELEVALTWEALSAPVSIAGSAEAGKSYGGFCARFAPRENTVLRADGVTLANDEDRTPRRWAELQASYGGRPVAVRITPDPADPGAPYQWCLRHYGFIGASFPGRTDTVDHYTLEPGKPLTLRFRVRIADLGGARD